MKPLQIFEFDKLTEAGEGEDDTSVPARVFTWLEEQCLGIREGTPAWLKLTRHGRRRAIQVCGYVGVLRAPCGFQIEVLPKIGRHACAASARTRLIEMLKCLRGFRHVRTANAQLRTEQMPLLEVFLHQFLLAVGQVVQRGLRSDYSTRQENLFSLRGKLLVTRHLSQNLLRRDRFFAEYDEFTSDRAENRLIHSALRKTLALCKVPDNQRLARELSFVFADVPPCTDIAQDLARVRLDRGMHYYQPALDWARLILEGDSPLTGAGKSTAPSLLFPMDALFEAYVAKHLARQMKTGFDLSPQVSRHHLVSHREQDWFRLKPDLLITQGERTHLVLDTKWKLLDSTKGNGRDKYLLSQSDFYQLHTYAHLYLKEAGSVVLIYPRTDLFNQPLPVFDFRSSHGLKLWVLPFCLVECRLLLPGNNELCEYLMQHDVMERTVTDRPGI